MVRWAKALLTIVRGQSLTSINTRTVLRAMKINTKLFQRSSLG